MKKIPISPTIIFDVIKYSVRPALVKSLRDWKFDINSVTKGKGVLLNKPGKIFLYFMKKPMVSIASIGLSSGLMSSSYLMVVSNLSADRLIEKADQLYDNLEFQEIEQLLTPHREVKNANILWRLARAMYERSQTKDADKKKVLGEALELLKEAESLDADNFAVHKWLAIIMNCYYTLEGTKSRISHLFEMRQHMEKACNLRPEDGTSWYVLGMWFYGIADISWYERKAASIFFESPPQASYSEALDIFMQAEKAEPGFYSKNYLMIAKCLYNLGRKEEAKEYLIKAQNYQQKTSDDREAKAEAEKWLKSL